MGVGWVVVGVVVGRDGGWGVCKLMFLRKNKGGLSL